MKFCITCILLAVLTFIAGSSAVVGADPPKNKVQPPKPVKPSRLLWRGELKLIDIEKKIVVMEFSKPIGELTLKIDSKAKYTLNGVTTDLRQLKPSDNTLVLIIDDGTECLVQAIYVTDPNQETPPKPKFLNYRGTIKAVDLEKGTLTLAHTPLNASEKEEVRTYRVDDEARILWESKAARLADFKPDATGTFVLKIVGNEASISSMNFRPLAVANPRPVNNGRFVEELGVLTAIDAEKMIVTVGFAGANGLVEKPFEIAKETPIVVDGKMVNLGDLKVGDGATIRMSTDRKTLLGITIGKPTANK